MSREKKIKIKKCFIPYFIIYFLKVNKMAYFNEERAESVLKELELRRWLLDEKIDQCLTRNAKIPYIEEQTKLEVRMYQIIDNYPSLERFISNINK